MSTIRVTPDADRRIANLSKQTGRPMTEVVDDAVDALERSLFFADLDAGFETLRADPVAWREVEVERAAEGSALRDSFR